MPPRRGADTARIGDDDDDGPARRLLPNPHIPTSPRRVMSLRQPLSSRRCTCRRAQRAPWQILVRRVAFVVRVGTAILNSSRDHCRGIVRRAARKFKFHVEGVLARGRRAEKPPFARVLPRPTHQTSRCDAGVNRARAGAQRGVATEPSPSCEMCVAPPSLRRPAGGGGVRSANTCRKCPPRSSAAPALREEGRGAVCCCVLSSVSFGARKSAVAWLAYSYFLMMMMVN